MNGFDSDDLKKAFAGAGEKLKSEFGNLAEGVDIEALKEGADKLADEAAALVKKYPVQTTLAAFAAGCLVGALFAGRKRQ
jgi:ElaB/YqjD/DUF883 family membrane-anchored ribosome-binding protein